MTARIIAIAMQKGGVGKTTTAVNLAHALAELGHRVLLVDLDAQASASTWLGVTTTGEELVEVYTDGRPIADVTVRGVLPGVDLVPCGARFSERALVVEPDAVNSLAPALEPARRSYDFVLLDCPPSLGVVSTSALVASDEVLVPMEAAVLARDALPRLLDTLRRVRERHGVRLLGVLMVKADPTIITRQLYSDMKQQLGDALFSTVVRSSVRLREAPAAGQSILDYDGDGRGTEDYRALAGEVIERGEA